MDEELKFKAEARRNRLLGQWAAAKLGLGGSGVDDYVKAVRKADLAEKGDEDVFRKIRKDFDDKGVSVAGRGAAQGDGRVPGRGGGSRSRPKARRLGPASFGRSARGRHASVAVAAGRRERPH